MIDWWSTKFLKTHFSQFLKSRSFFLSISECNFSSFLLTFSELPVKVSFILYSCTNACLLGLGKSLDSNIVLISVTIIVCLAIRVGMSTIIENHKAKMATSSIPSYDQCIEWSTGFLSSMAQQIPEVSHSHKRTPRISKYVIKKLNKYLKTWSV